MSERVRVLVVDDSALMRKLIPIILSRDPGIEVVGTATDGLDLLHETKSLHPDLVLTDLGMPRISGLEATMELRKLFPELRILIFTELNGYSLRDECLRCGADGFVEKSQMPEKLMEQVRRLFPKNA